jgi:hypothetical protein
MSGAWLRCEGRGSNPRHRRKDRAAIRVDRDTGNALMIPTAPLIVLRFGQIQSNRPAPETVAAR